MAKNVTVTPADGDIQFENTSGTAAGRIEQNGDDLVISNAVGDVLFGDADSDVYIGDGVNSVDLLFEQSGSIKAEDGSTGVTLTLGSSDTTLSLYAPKITNLSTQSSEATALMINGSNVVGTRELGSAAFSASTAFVAVGGDTMTGQLIHTSDSNLSVRSATNGLGVGITFSDNATNNSYTQHGKITYFHGDGSSYGSGNCFVIGGSETTMTVLANGKLMYAEGIYSKPSSGTGAGTRKDSNWDTAYGWGNHASAGYLTSETYTGTVTSVTVGTGLDVATGTTTPNITLDLSELSDMTAAINTAQDELILLDNGAERRKLFSEIFGSAAYSNTSAFAAASHNHDSSYPAKSDSYISLFSDSWGDTPEAKYIQINLPYNSGSGASSYYVFDVFGFHDIRQMDSAVNYRVYAHIRSNGTEQNSVKIHVYTLHENQSDFFEFAYKIKAGAATEFFIYVEHDYSGIEIFGLPLEQGQFAELTSSMISSTQTAPTGTTQVVAKVAHPSIGTTAGTYGNTANGTKIDTITIDEHGHVTGVATGATGNMTGFFVEDGDGTEVQINNANEWKFVEGTGIDINWTDTSTGNDSDPYDLTFAIKNNSIGIDQLNVSDGTNGQVLTTNGSGTLSFSTVTSGSSYGWTLGGTDIESGDEVALGGGLSLSGTGGTYTLTSANDNTTYTAGTGLTLTGTEFSVTANTYAAASHTHTFDSLTSKTSGTGDYSTSGDLQSGRNSGGVALTINDGYGNANITWNHRNGTPEQNGNAARIEVNTDSTTGATMWFEIKSGMTSGTAASLTNVMQMTESGLSMESGKTISAGGKDSDDWNTAHGWGNHADGNYLTAETFSSSDVVLTLDGNDVIAGDDLILAGGLSYNASTNTLTQSDNNTTYSAATTSADGLMSSTDKTKLDGIATGANAYVHPTGAGNKHIPTGGAAGQFLKYSSSGTAVWATPSYTTNTNTTYSAGSGLDLTSTTFSVEADLRDGITHVGVDTKNYITFDPTNGRIDFYAGNVFVARLESDGDLHVKGDVIAFSSIFS
jgi:hypothetical protein